MPVETTLLPSVFSKPGNISKNIYIRASSPIQHIRSQPRLAEAKDCHLTLYHLLLQRQDTFGPGLLQNKCILIWNIRSRIVIKKIRHVLYPLLSHTPSGYITSCVILRYRILWCYETRKLLMSYLHRDWKNEITYWNNREKYTTGFTVLPHSQLGFRLRKDGLYPCELYKIFLKYGVHV